MPTVLVADDDPLARAVAVQILTVEGFDCTEADDGADAIAAVRNCAPDLLVTDMCMPGKDGFDTIKAVRAMAPGCRIIAVSGGFPGMTADVLLMMAKGVGADDVVAKPLRRETFAPLARAMLAKSA